MLSEREEQKKMDDTLESESKRSTPFQTERNHSCKILYMFLKKMMEGLVLFIIIIKNHDGFGGNLFFYVLFLMLLSMVFFSILDWYKQVFYFYKEAIYYKSGLLNVKIREIPFQRVTTVDLTEGILDKIFGTVKVKVDTGNLSKNESELSLLLDKRRALEVRSLILNRPDHIKTDSKTFGKGYDVSATQLMLYACTSNAVAKGIGIIFVAYTFLDDYIFDIFDIRLLDYEITAEYLWGKAIWVVAGVILISTFLSIMQSLIQYYNFRIDAEGDKLNICYGLLNQKHYSFSRDKIKGVHMRQNALMQLFHLKTLEIESIGYGDEKGESAILFPICNAKLEEEIMDKLLPEFVYKGKIQVLPKRALLRFIWKKVLFLGILIAILMHYVSFGIAGVILLPFACWLGYMQFRNAAVGMDQELLTMSYNGMYKTKTVVKRTTVQSFEKSHSYFQKKAGLASFKVNIFSNRKYQSIKVKNLENHVVDNYLKKAR